MPGLFSNYKAIVLDASFFAGKFSEDIRQELAQSNVFVSQTFNAEVAQYTQILSSHRKAAYEANIAFLQSSKPLRTVSFGAQGAGQHNDTWGLVQVFIAANIKAVLVTADQLLIQRVVLANLQVDIYNLERNSFIYHTGFSTYAGYFALQNETQWAGSVQHQAQSVGTDTVLYCKNGSRITLGKKVGEGKEAQLFVLQENGNLIAKVFRKDRLPADKFKNILKVEGVNHKLDVDWALFPIDVVYYDSACTRPAGFTEGFAKTTMSLDENLLYLGEVDLPDRYLQTRVSDTLELCLKVVRQIRYLSSYGFMISDFNMGNFALRSANSPSVQMWDTDSFGYESYFSGYCAGNRTSREYDICSKADAIGFCNDALYLFVFSLLSLGDSPISEFSGKFKYDNPKYPGKFRKELIPANLWQLFESVFRGEKEPSAEMLLYELHEALHQCNTVPSKNKTYKQLLNKVLTAVAQAKAEAAAQQTQKTPQSGSTYSGQPKPTGSTYSGQPKPTGNTYSGQPKPTGSTYSGQPKPTGSTYSGQPRTTGSTYSGQSKPVNNQFHYSDPKKNSTSNSSSGSWVAWLVIIGLIILVCIIASRS